MLKRQAVGRWAALLCVAFLALTACGSGEAEPKDVSEKTITVKEKPPELSQSSAWDDIGKTEEVLAVMSGAKANERDVAYFSQSRGGYLYQTIPLPLNAEEKEQARKGAQNVIPRNELQRIDEHGQVHFGDPAALLLKSVNAEWRIESFWVSDHYIWWIELNDKAPSQDLRLYERPLSGGKPKLLAEMTPANPGQAAMQHGIGTDKDRLVVQWYDKESKAPAIFYRDPAKDVWEQWATLPAPKEKDQKYSYFYDPQLQGHYAVWGEGELQDGAPEKSKVVLYDMTTKKKTVFVSPDYAMSEPVLSGHHLVVRMKPQGENFVMDEQGNVTAGAELWHYQLQTKKWDFRITKDSPIYKNKEQPITLYSPQVAGDYLIWRVEPEITAPFLVDMQRICAYPVPMDANERMAYMTITPEALYWKVVGDQKEMHKATFYQAMK